ncbi:MAG: imidazoleglycerol-phosphate dehydratase HisB [Candidatus Hadarchaeales archaeon]
MKARRASRERKTRETSVSVRLNLEGEGRARISTGIPFLEHMLESMARHGRFDLEIEARGDLKHHLAEDVFIALGEALSQALGEKAGILRFGEAAVPMDEVLVLVAVDLSGRPYFSSNLTFSQKRVEGVESELFPHLLRSLSSSGRFTLHVLVLREGEDHHKLEATFKALGLALSRAWSIGRGTGVPSTKGVLDG